MLSTATTNNIETSWKQRIKKDINTEKVVPDAPTSDKLKANRCSSCKSICSGF